MQVWKLIPLVALVASACATTPIDTSTDGSTTSQASEPVKAMPRRVAYNADPYPSTYKPLPSDDVLIRNATVYDGLGGEIKGGAVLIQGGKITAVGSEAAMTMPAGIKTIDATGKFVTPGIIDIHSHLGAYPSPGIGAHQDGNEVSAPVTAEVWVEHSIWPQDPGFTRAMAGGVTAMQILPGSANLFGGRGVIIKAVPATTAQGMKFPGAPYTLKMACGENPKRVYGYGGGRFPGGAPFSRMGNVAGYREAWQRAVEYKRKWDKYNADFDAWEKKVKSPAPKTDDKGPGDPPNAPDRNLELDTLMGVLNGEILVQQHCYRADEMAQIIDLSKEFGYKVSAFHHGVEAYKVAGLLAANGICGALWADWWGFKAEAYDGIRENIPMVHNATGGCAIVHSDDANGIQRLNQEAAKALADGRRVGIDISNAVAWTWLSRNPAKALGILDKTGTLESGKAADVVIWSGDPFSVYTRADIVFVDGAVTWDRSNEARRPVTDFELGQPGEGDVK
ncbi:MAG: amidohydrolase [Alphaproteobacteria bacterium 32-64-14]|nr:MAG: amidohydrolase [Alphaproteobacteria bacterium 32-64-14]